MSSGSVRHAVLLVLGLLNVALVVRFYRHCFKDSIAEGRERLAQSFTFIPSSKGRSKERTNGLPWLDKDEEADRVMGMGFTRALGLEPYGNINIQRESERIQLRGARLLQMYFYEKQIRACGRGEKVKIYQLPEEHHYGLFSQVLGAAHSLLDATVHGYVFSWNVTRLFYADQRRCPSRSFECFFLPVTSCTRENAVLFREKSRNSCVFEMPKRRVHEQPFMVNASEWQDVLPILRSVTGIDALGRPDLFNAQFFSREALRFLTRPNDDLVRLTQDILKEDLVAPADWRPFSPTIRRVAAHLRAGADKKGHTGVLGPEYYLKMVQSIATLGLEQVMFSSDDRESHINFEAGIPNITVDECGSRAGTVKALYIPQERFGQTKSFHHDYLAGSTEKEQASAAVVEYDIGMLLIAQAYIFATADAFVGLFASNVGVSIALYMSALRHTSAIPVFDVGGSPWPTCHQFTEYPLRFIRHPDMYL